MHGLRAKLLLSLTKQSECTGSLRPTIHKHLGSSLERTTDCTHQLQVRSAVPLAGDAVGSQKQMTSKDAWDSLLNAKTRYRRSAADTADQYQSG